MKVIGKDRTSCDVCNPIDEILARLDALERRASAIVAKVQGLAPDGEGNVTLPTSSSDTDPLHGRVDTFAMSSEVKEAADDAHAYAASIADDVIVINSEIDALNQAVAALQPAEIEAIKAAVQALQSTVATLESAVDTLNNSVAEKQDTLTAGSNITIDGTTISAKDTTYDVATQSANGLMSSTDKSKLDGITESADAVSFTRSLTTGTKVGTITINGTGTDIYCQTNTDTKVTQNNDTSTNANLPILVSATADSTTARTGTVKYVNGKAYINPSTGQLTATRFHGPLTGDVTGNSDTATKATQDASGNVITKTYATKTEVTSGLAGKQATITGGATTIVSNNLTASRALISDASGKVAISAVTSTELGYLDGVTSNVQTQLNGKSAEGHTHDDRYYTESEVDSAMAGKVSKSGDTMTGNLTIEKSWIPLITLHVTSASLANPASSARDLGYTFEDSRGFQIGSMYERIATNGDLYLSLQTKSDKSGSEIKSAITINNNADGSRYATAPSWSPGTNDNSDKILTIKMANSLPSLVHTTGNETINGIKTFSTSPIVPDTPSNATGSEIAVAKWVISRINELATKNGLNGL